MTMPAHRPSGLHCIERAARELTEGGIAPDVLPEQQGTRSGMPEAARVLALDGMRGLAALLVFFCHTLQVPTGGYLGVDLFFVLSGFLITSILLRELRDEGRLRFLRFFMRRAQRLLPAFLLMAGLYCGIRYCFAPEQPGIGPVDLVRLLFLANISSAIPFLSHSWSLAAEWQFYLVWPFLLAGLAALRLPWAAFVLCCLAGAALSWVARLHWGIDLHVDGLLLGASLAGFTQGGGLRVLPKRPLLEQSLLAAALALIVLLAFVSDYGSHIIPLWAGYIFVPVLTTIMLAITTNANSPTARILLGNPVLVYFGRISYGFYVYHFPIAALLFVHGYSPARSLLIGLVVTVPLSDFSWRYVEQPLLRRRWRVRGVYAAGRRPRRDVGRGGGDLVSDRV